MKQGLLLLNLGSPDSPSVKDVRRYLNQFLMDEYVIDVPYILRALIVKCFVLPFRPKKSAEAYSEVWTERGSPLITISQDYYEGVKKQLNVPTELAMRYGNPSIPSALKKLKEAGVQKLLVFPLYPHYAMSTTLTGQVEVESQIKKLNYNIETKYIEPFYEDKNYIEILSETISSFVKKKSFEHLIFSYHGLPERHLRKTDPTKEHCMKVSDCCNNPSVAHSKCYKAQTVKTTDGVVKTLGLAPNQYTIAYQSRLGSDPWIKPFTEDTVIKLAKEGKKHIHVVCPAFVADCLETLEEIQMGLQETFEENGGETLTLIPCLNVNQKWIDLSVNWVNDSLKELV